MAVAAVLLALLGKLGAFGRDISLAYAFGVGVETDAYFIANIIPALLWLAFHGTIAAVFLPQYVRAKNGANGQPERLAVEAVRLYAALAVLLMVATVLFARPLVELTVGGCEPGCGRLVDQAATLTRIMAVGFLFTGYVGVQNALQQANGRYLWPLAVPPINQAITIAGIFVGAWLGSIEIAVAAAVLGWVVQAPIQRFQTRDLYAFAPGWRIRPDVLRRLSLLSLPVIVAVFLDQANIYIGIAIAGQFGPGAVSHLGYASRLALFLANLVSWLVAYFLFPRLAAHVAADDEGGVARDLTLGLILIAGLTLPMMAFALLHSRELVAIAYGRGAFTGADVSATAAVFTAYLFGIVFIGLREILNRVFFSYEQTRIPMMIGVLAAALNIGMSLYLSRLFGLAGVAMGASLAAVAFVAMQFAALAWTRPRSLDVRDTWRAAALVAATAAGFLAGSAASSATQALGRWPMLFLSAVVLAGVYCLVLALLDRLLGLELASRLRAFRGSSS